MLRHGSEASLKAVESAVSLRSGMTCHREQMRILVVDDDQYVAGAVRRGFVVEGFAVDVAVDGTEGRWLATENAYDALVLDSMMPGLSGEELCTSLRRSGDWTPILMLTARTGHLHEAAALDAGADDYLAKPFSFDVLLARLRALVRRSPHERPTILTVGDMRLDPATHRMWRGDTPIHLTPRQFSMLEFFMRRAGDVLSKPVIIENVWDFSFDGDPNIVEVYVRQLRQRIDEPFGRTSLQTLRLVGYRLDPDGG
jgi:two-component system OmpR family response regulator